MSNENNIEKKIAEKLSSRKFEIKPEWRDDMNTRLKEYNHSKKRVGAIWLGLFILTLIGTAIWYNTTINKATKHPHVAQTKLTENNTLSQELPDDHTSSSNDKALNSPAEILTGDKTVPEKADISNTKSSGVLNNTPVFSIQETKKQDEAAIPILLHNDKTPSDKEIPSLINNTNNTSTLPDDMPTTTEINTDSVLALAESLPDTITDQTDTATQSQSSTPAANQKKNSQWELGLVVGPSMAFKKPREYESPAGYFDVKLSLSNKLSNKLRYNTGLNYTSYGENLKYSPVKFIVNDTNYIIKDTFSLQIDSFWSINIREWIYDTTVIPVTDTFQTINKRDSIDNSILKANNKTRFSYLEVPFSISFPIAVKNSYRINLIAGGSIGYLIKSSGSYYRDHKIVQARSQKVIYNALLGAGFDYDIGNNLNFRTQVIAKRNLKNIGSAGTPYRQYTTFNISLGVIYKF